MPNENITRLLHQAGRGSPGAVNELLPLVYDELRRLADRYLQSERKAHTLQATALVHEAYLRLVRVEDLAWTDRAHFYRLAAMAMRRILVEHARKVRTDKRGGGFRRTSLAADEIASPEEDEVDLLALDRALSRLADQNEQKARVVELRFFGGLTNAETARVLGVTCRTVERNWRFARAWLHREIAAGHG